MNWAIQADDLRLLPPPLAKALEIKIGNFRSMLELA
jgi:hypothetical protein